MHIYTEQTFNIPELKGISRKAIDAHLKLYSGYVKNVNLINDKIAEYRADSEKHAYALSELQRRFSFEFNGMRNHEYYFFGFDSGPQPLAEESTLRAQIEKDFAHLGGFDGWIAAFKAMGLTRGIGWAMLYYDSHLKVLTHAWVDEQHLGQLNGLQLVLGLDMWEHAFLYDFPTGDKKAYIEAFFENLNWGMIEKSFVWAARA